MARQDQAAGWVGFAEGDGVHSGPVQPKAAADTTEQVKKDAPPALSRQGKAPKRADVGMGIRSIECCYISYA
jgi:hypothetical protein